MPRVPHPCCPSLPPRPSDSTVFTLCLCLLPSKAIPFAREPGSQTQHFAYLMIHWPTRHVTQYTLRKHYHWMTDKVHKQVYNGLWPEQYLPLVHVYEGKGINVKHEQLEMLIQRAGPSPHPEQRCGCRAWVKRVASACQEGGWMSSTQLIDMTFWDESLCEGTCEICGWVDLRVNTDVPDYQRSLSPSPETARFWQPMASLSPVERASISPQTTQRLARWRETVGISAPTAPIGGAYYAY